MIGDPRKYSANYKAKIPDFAASALEDKFLWLGMPGNIQEIIKRKNTILQFQR